MNNCLSLLSKHRSALMGFAILWIVLYHLPMGFRNFIVNVGYGGVDIFLFLSGFGLFYSMSLNNYSTGQFYKKRLKRILPEFWLFLLVEFIIAQDFTLKSFCDLLCCATTLGYWIKIIPYEFWYISCILLFYLIFPLFYEKFQKYGVKAILAAICIGLLLTAVYSLVMVFGFDNRNTGGLLILSISRIPIFFIGTLFGHLTKNGYGLKLNVKTVALSLFVLVTAFLTLFYFRARLYDYEWTCSLFALPFIAITPVMCVMLAVVFEYLPRLITQSFAGLGFISLELYMTHAYLIELFYPTAESPRDGSTAILVFSLSLISAVALYYINKYLMQRAISKV